MDACNSRTWEGLEEYHFELLYGHVRRTSGTLHPDETVALGGPSRPALRNRDLTGRKPRGSVWLARLSEAEVEAQSRHEAYLASTQAHHHQEGARGFFTVA